MTVMNGGRWVLLVLAAVCAQLAWDGLVNELTPWGVMWLPLAGVAAVALAVAAVAEDRWHRPAVQLAVAAMILVAAVRAVAWLVVDARTPAAIWVGFGVVTFDWWRRKIEGHGG